MKKLKTMDVGTDLPAQWCLYFSIRILGNDSFSATSTVDSFSHPPHRDKVHFGVPRPTDESVSECYLLRGDWHFCSLSAPVQHLYLQVLPNPLPKLYFCSWISLCLLLLLYEWILTDASSPSMIPNAQRQIKNHEINPKLLFYSMS